MGGEAADGEDGGGMGAVAGGGDLRAVGCCFSAIRVHAAAAVT